MAKYKSKFNLSMQKDYPFLKPKSGSENELLCTLCDSTFSIAARGRAAIKDHLTTSRHTKAANIVQSNRSLDGMLSSSPAVMALQAKELTFAFHTGNHRISSCTADCNSKLVKECFDPKFSCGATKTSKLVENVNKHKKYFV